MALVVVKIDQPFIGNIAVVVFDLLYSFVGCSNCFANSCLVIWCSMRIICNIVPASIIFKLSFKKIAEERIIPFLCGLCYAVTIFDYCKNFGIGFYHLRNRLAIPIGLFVPASHASIVFTDTPIASAKVACVMPTKAETNILYFCGGKIGYRCHGTFCCLAFTLPFSNSTASFNP